MGATVRKQCWAGELRKIGRRRGTEEVFVGGVRVALIQKNLYVINLSLPIHGSEQRKASVQGLAIDFLNEGLGIGQRF